MNEHGGTAYEHADRADHPFRVVITDVHMPFWSMVTFMVKWAVAAIPAVLILILLWGLILALSGGLLSGCGWWSADLT